MAVKRTYRAEAKVAHWRGTPGQLVAVVHAAVDAIADRVRGDIHSVPVSITLTAPSGDHRYTSLEEFRRDLNVSRFTDPDELLIVGVGWPDNRVEIRGGAKTGLTVEVT